MNLYRNILIPTDGSSTIMAAISFALTLAKFTGANVTALGVNDESNYAIPGDTTTLDPDTPQYQACEKAVAGVVSRGEEVGIGITPRIITGIPAQVIIDASGEYDLIVMGTAGRSGINLLLLGSVAQKVIRFSTCPVLVIRGDYPAHETYGRILIPTEGTGITENAISHGLEMARIFKADVTALSVTSEKKRTILGGVERSFSFESAENSVAEVVRDGQKLGISVTPVVLSGQVAEEIITASTSHDLLVMGTEGRTGLEYVRMGSVAEKTVRHARCPILVVRGVDTALPEARKNKMFE